METGIELIAKERQRQIDKEGWTSEHDDRENQNFQLSLAACSYLNASNSELANRFWPWDWRFWKPDTHLRNLIKAGALIAAEIDRLQRKNSL